MGIVTLKGKTEKQVELADTMSGVQLLTLPEVQQIKEQSNDLLYVQTPDNVLKQVRPGETYQVPDGTTLRRTSANDRAGSAR